MQPQNIRMCPGCGKVVTLKDKRKKYCNRLCYRGGEYRADAFHRLLSAATPIDCIEWPYGKTDKGYGTLRYNGTPYETHRLSFELFVGPLIGEECALHKCDNRPCFNYHHLFKGSRADNSDDMLSKDRAIHKSVPSLCKLTESQVVEIKNRWIPRNNSSILAKEFGVTREHIHRIATGDSRGGSGKTLTSLQMAEIHQRWIPHSNAAQLAKEYGITISRIGQIGRNKRYACTT